MSRLPAERVLAEGRFLRLLARGHWEYAERTTASGAVAIVATIERRLVLVEQFRIPMDRPVIELPAGLAGDVPEDLGTDEAAGLANAARRELLEETGYEAGQMRLLASGPPSAGFVERSGQAFFHATELRKIHSGGGDPHEAITVHEPPLAELDAWLRARAAAGALIDPKIFAGLYLAASRGNNYAHFPQRPFSSTSVTSPMTDEPIAALGWMLTLAVGRQETVPQSTQTKCGCSASPDVPPTRSSNRQTWSPSSIRQTRPASASSIRLR